jgi:hypothetical protein
MIRFMAAVLVLGGVLVGLLLLLGLWSSMAPETREVFRRRCSEEPEIEEAARLWQTRLWAALVEERAGRVDLNLVLNARFCGAPHKSLCFTLAEALVSEPRLRARLQQLEPGSPEILNGICYGELDDAQSDLLTGGPQGP